MGKDVGVRSIEDLRNFAAYLINLSDEMEAAFNDARSKMHWINEGWDDTRNAEFMLEFEESIKIINLIAEDMREHGKFVNKQCDKLDDY